MCLLLARITQLDAALFLSGAPAAHSSFRLWRAPMLARFVVSRELPYNGFARFGIVRLT
jgi:hypothetical protein